MSATPPMTMRERLALTKLESRIARTDPAEIVVGDRYVVAAVLGQGGTGEVVRAHDRELDREVALKHVRAAPSRSLGQVVHGHVVPVLDVVDDPLGVFVVREHVDGDDLRGWLAAEPRSWSDILDVMLAAARGLAAVHAAGLVHGDLNPDHVLVGRDAVARIVDFGLAVAQPDATPGYLAPEQYAGEPADATSDQLAFCLTLFEALYAVRAIDAKLVDCLRVDPFAWALPPRPRTTAVPQPIHAVIARGAARERSERYPTMAALIDALVDARGRASSRRHVVAAIAVGLGSAIAAAWGLLRD